MASSRLVNPSKSEYEAGRADSSDVNTSEKSSFVRPRKNTDKNLTEDVGNEVQNANVSDTIFPSSGEIYTGVNGKDFNNTMKI